LGKILKNMWWFVLVRGYGVCAGGSLRLWGVGGGMGVGLGRFPARNWTYHLYIC
jgi:hypothetical protein